MKPASSNQHRWILTTTDYFTKWVEAILVKQALKVGVIDFLVNNILSRFGCPRKLLIDNAKVFTSHKMVKFCNDYNIILSHSTTYYPQGNGLAESSNKSLERIIKKLLKENKRAWHSKLKYALWDDIISIERVIGTSPFLLVYGLDVVFPTSLGIPVMKYLQEEEANTNAIQRRINQLIEIKQVRDGVCDKFQIMQVLMRVKIPHKKWRHCSFRNSQLDSRMFGVVGLTGLWTRYHSKVWFMMGCFKSQESKVSQLSN